MPEHSGHRWIQRLHRAFSRSCRSEHHSGPLYYNRTGLALRGALRPFHGKRNPEDSAPAGLVSASTYGSGWLTAGTVFSRRIGRTRLIGSMLDPATAQLAVKIHQVSRSLHPCRDQQLLRGV